MQTLSERHRLRIHIIKKVFLFKVNTVTATVTNLIMAHVQIVSITRYLTIDWLICLLRNTVCPNSLFFFIQLNIPFKIISLISRQANRWVGQNGSTPGKPPDTPASRTWLVSHVASAGLEPTPATAVNQQPLSLVSLPDALRVCCLTLNW